MPVYRKLALYGLSIFVTGAGILHFVIPQFFIDIVPDYLPAKRMIVYLSGVAEIALGLGLLVPRLRRLSAWGLIALFIAVFPANIYMASHGITPTGLPPIPAWAQIARLPLQLVFIFWAHSFTKEVPAQ